MSGDLVQSVDQNSSERKHYTILKALCEFPQTSSIVLY
jgi:hypothetical protein